MELSREKINVILARKQMSISTLAEACGVSRNRMHVLMNSRNVTPAAAGKVAKGLAVDVTEIIEN